MISFDNGPADGDYVRYIEAMARTAARAVAETATSQPTSMSTRVAGATGFEDTTMQARLREVEARRAATAPAPTAAVAKAVALQSAAGRTAFPAMGRALSLMLAGALLVVIGFSMQPASVIVPIIGIVVAVVGFRQASNAFDALRSRSRSAGT